MRALLLSVLLASTAAFGTLDSRSGGCADKEEKLPTIVAMMPAEEMQAIPAGAMAMMNTCAGMQTAGALLCTMDEENFMLTRTCQKMCNAPSCGEFPDPHPALPVPRPLLKRAMQRQPRVPPA